MDVSGFISRRIAFKGRWAVVSIAVSFAVMIFALAIAGGFTREISEGLSLLSGDISIRSCSNSVPLSASGEGIPSKGDCYDAISEIEGVESIDPVICCGGIVRCSDDIYGVVFKGIQSCDSAGLKVVVPRHFARKASLLQGSELQTYFVGERVTVRKFTVSGFYDSIVAGSDKVVIFCDIHTLRRVLGWDVDKVSSMDVKLAAGVSGEAVCEEISSILYYSDEDFAGDLCCSSVSSSYRSFFDWLRLVDFNMNVILILMIVVSGFNMVGGLLILLFENISTIGLLKGLGMTNGRIAATFLLSSSRAVLLAMLSGNALSIGLCLVQHHFHLIGLNPENYFISFVPVALNPVEIFAVDTIVFLVIMLVLLIPCTFISKVDPSRTLSVR